MSKAKDEYGYPAAPRQVNDDYWFYEQREGFVVVARGCSSVTIPWRRIEAAVDNHRKAKTARKRR